MNKSSRSFSPLERKFNTVKMKQLTSLHRLRRNIYSFQNVNLSSGQSNQLNGNCRNENFPLCVYEWISSSGKRQILLFSDFDSQYTILQGPLHFPHFFSLQFCRGARNRQSSAASRFFWSMFRYKFSCCLHCICLYCVCTSCACFIYRLHSASLRLATHTQRTAQKREIFLLCNFSFIIISLLFCSFLSRWYFPFAALNHLAHLFQYLFPFSHPSRAKIDALSESSYFIIRFLHVPNDRGQPATRQPSASMRLCALYSVHIGYMR